MAKLTVVLDRTAARMLSLPVERVVWLCRNGHFIGARFDWVAAHWRIPLPLRPVPVGTWRARRG